MTLIPVKSLAQFLLPPIHVSSSKQNNIIIICNYSTINLDVGPGTREPPFMETFLLKYFVIVFMVVSFLKF